MPHLEPLTLYRADFPALFAALDAWQKDAETRRRRLSLAETPLSIGVIGQVKAGKSSFLNQLLFKGEPLLPEAATPQTANLTRIRFGATPAFTARFYAPEDWREIEQLAATSDEGDGAAAARGLVQDARAHGLDVAALLAQGSVTRTAATLEELLAILPDYVAAKGRYTALVADSEITLPLPQLEGIEIVDTPGLNDPVLSRTEKTRDYLAQCDVVFLLTRASQNFDASDQALVAKQLPAKGVKRLIFVASQFDSVFLEDGYDRKSFAECENRLRVRLRQHIANNLERLAARREQQGYPEVATLLRGIQPIFSSSYAYVFATQPEARWSADQRHTWQQFQDLAQDAWSGARPSAEDWRRIAGFDELHAAFAQARADKEAILAAQRENLEVELAKTLREHLENLHAQAEERLNFLKNNELGDLEQHAARTQKRLDAIAEALQRYVHAQTDQARKKSRNLLREVEEAAQRAQRIEERTEVKTRHRAVEVSDSVWYKPWTWGKSHTEYYTETETTSYLAAADAVENLNRYFGEMRRSLLALFDDLIAPAAISAGLRRELLQAIDSQRSDFDPRALRALVETAIAQLDLPKTDVPAPNANKMFEGFSSKITSYSEMARLRERLEAAVAQTRDAFVHQVESAVAATCTQLDTMARELQATLSRNLQEELDHLRAQMQNKAHEIERMQTLINTITPQLTATS